MLYIFLLLLFLLLCRVRRGRRAPCFLTKFECKGGRQVISRDLWALMCVWVSAVDRFGKAQASGGVAAHPSAIAQGRLSRKPRESGGPRGGYGAPACGVEFGV